MAGHRIYAMSVAKVYPAYIAKAERKGRTKAEIDQIIRWLTGHTQKTLDRELEANTSLEAFFADAPRMNPLRSLITGVVWRHPRRDHRGAYDARNPLPRQTDRRTCQGQSHGQNPAHARLTHPPQLGAAEPLLDDDSNPALSRRIVRTTPR
jgi:hypothetical protein